MKLDLHNFRNKLASTLLLVIALLASANILALESEDTNSFDFDTWTGSLERQNETRIEPSVNDMVRPLRWVKNDARNFRSRGEVVSEVKRRYKAKVLRISLNEQRGVYNIRILLPSGKVKSVQLSAYR